MYQEIKPKEDLRDLVHSFWFHQNLSDAPEQMTILPDSFFKIIFLVKEEKITKYFLTGLWTAPQDITIPPKVSSYGCRLKILAPEFLICEELPLILDGIRPLRNTFLDIEKFHLSNFENIVEQWEEELQKIRSAKSISEKKLKLSRLLDEAGGDISVAEISEQTGWKERQINRYLNKYLGISLKKYLIIQKCYFSYIQIREGNFFPEQGFFDQSHFIREIKKHTGKTPTDLFKQQNDRFIQLKNIQKE